MKYFVSDLHIADKSELDHFGKLKEEIFISMLNRIDSESNHRGELILLGDIIDFSVLKVLATKGIEITNMINKVAKVYKNMFQELRNFIIKGNRLYYVWGNHDYALRYYQHLHHLQCKILKWMWDKKHFIKISGGDYYYSASHKIYAEHGHRFDIDNIHLHNRPISFGNYIADILVRKWERFYCPQNPNPYKYPFKEVDGIRPRSRLIYYVNWLINNNLITGRAKIEILNDLMRAYNEAKMPLPSILNKLFKNLPEKIKDTIVYMGLKDSLPKILRNKAKKLLLGYHNELLTTKRRTITVTETFDLPFLPKVVVFGHSHFLDFYKIGDQAIYVNTGTWRSTILVNENGELSKTETLYPVIRVSKKEKQLFPEVTVLDAMTWETIPIYLINERYRLYEKNMI